MASTSKFSCTSVLWQINGATCRPCSNRTPALTLLPTATAMAMAMATPREPSRWAALRGGGSYFQPPQLSPPLRTPLAGPWMNCPLPLVSSSSSRSFLPALCPAICFTHAKWMSFFHSCCCCWCCCCCCRFVPCGCCFLLASWPCCQPV